MVRRQDALDVSVSGIINSVCSVYLVLMVAAENLAITFRVYLRVNLVMSTEHMVKLAAILF